MRQENDFEGLNLVDLLNLLEPVIEPDPVSMWPQTQGWLWLGGAVLLTLVYAIWRGWKAWKARAYRRAALAEIAQAGAVPGQLANILRRTALSAFPRAEIASLHGEAWLAFLDETSGTDLFTQGAGRPIADAPYRTSDADPALSASVATWVRRHKASRQERAA